MGFRISTAWTQQGDRLGGFTENFWINTEDRSIANAAAEDLVIQSRSAKGDQAYCKRFRVSIPDVFRSGKTVKRPGAGPRGGTSFPSDYQTTKWQIKMKASKGETVQWIGGLPDDYVIDGGSFNQAKLTQVSWVAFVNQLTASGALWSVRILDPGVPKKDILQIDPATGIVQAPTHGLVTGDKVRIRGVRGLTIANGLWKIIAITGDADRFQLPNWVATTTVMTKSNASVRKQQYTYDKIQSVEVVQASSHRAGRPTGLLGGRPKRRRTA